MYILVREDLSPGQQVVQACHAVAEAARFFLSKEEEHPHFVICGVKNETALRKAYFKIQEQGIQLQAFIEPDIGNQMTAIATEPVSDSVRRTFRNYQLLKPLPPVLEPMLLEEAA